MYALMPIVVNGRPPGRNGSNTRLTSNECTRRKEGGGDGCKDFLESNETITTRLFLSVTREGGC